MLVLSRKSRESVVVGGVDGFPSLLKVTVLGIDGGKVKLGFEVDASVPVHRAEVWERIRRAEQGFIVTSKCSSCFEHHETRKPARPPLLSPPRAVE